MYVPPTSSNVIHLFCKHPVLLVITIIAGITFSGAVAYDSYAPCEKSLVTFTFDDAYLSTYTTAYPILDKYDYKATAFIPTNFLGKDNYMSEKQVMMLKAYGWEIGSHSKSHTMLTTLTNPEVMMELRDSQKILDDITLSKVSGFATPEDAWNGQIIEDIKSVYAYHRTCTPGYNDIPPLDVYYLKSMVIKDTTTVEEVKGWIDYARMNQKWLILTFHKIGEDGTYNWPAENLEEIVKYAHDTEYVAY